MKNRYRVFSRPPSIVGTKHQIVISECTDAGYNFIPDHLTTIPTKLVNLVKEVSPHTRHNENARQLRFFDTSPPEVRQLVREKRLSDCLDWISENLGIADNEQAIALLGALQGGLR